MTKKAIGLAIIIILSLILYGVAHRTSSQLITFCDPNYPISFDYPRNLQVSDNIVLAVFGDQFFINITVEPLSESQKSSIYNLIQQDVLNQDDKGPDIRIVKIGEHNARISTFPAGRSEFDKKYGSFRLRYSGDVLMDDYVIGFGGLQNSEDDTLLWPTLEQIIGSLRLNSSPENCVNAQ